jgi:O-antigen/teichoic acid export membrane protein
MVESALGPVDEPGRHRAQQISGRLGALAQIHRDSLYRNSFYLLLNMLVTSAAGFVFWSECAHIFTARDVGYGTAAMSAANIVLVVAGLGLNRTVVRFFHSAPDRKSFARDILVLVGAAAIGAASVLASILYHLGASRQGWLFACVFIACAFFATTKAVVDNIFVAMRTSRLLFLENLAFNGAKIVLPFAFATLGALGILLSQAVALALGMLCCTVLLVRTALPISHRPFRRVESLRGLWGFTFANYASDIVGGMPNNVLPLILVAKLGAEKSAAWFIAAQIATVIFLICSAINQSLYAEASADEQNLWLHVRKAALAMFCVVIPLTVLVAWNASRLLLIFGPSYTIAAEALRLLAASAIFVMLNFVLGSVLSILRHVKFMLIVNVVNAVLVVGCSAAFAHSLLAVGVMWLLGEIANVILFGLGVACYVRTQKYSQARVTIRAHTRSV